MESIENRIFQPKTEIPPAVEGVDPRLDIGIQNPINHESGEFNVREIALALSGLKLWFLRKAREHIAKKADEVERSADVHSIAAKRIFQQGRPKLGDTGLEALRSDGDEETIKAYHITDIPRTKSQQRQAYRAARRLHKNMGPATRRRNIELIYDDNPVFSSSVGSKPRKEEIKRSHMPTSKRRSQMRANRGHIKMKEKIEKNNNKLNRMQTGRDIPGRVLNRRATSLRWLQQEITNRYSRHLIRAAKKS